MYVRTFKKADLDIILLLVLCVYDVPHHLGMRMMMCLYVYSHVS
jgi:hypothetical protein